MARKHDHLPGQLIENLDIIIAISLLKMLQFIRSTGKASEETDMWMAYCCFHSGDYIRAKTVSRCTLCYTPSL